MVSGASKWTALKIGVVSFGVIIFQMVCLDKVKRSKCSCNQAGEVCAFPFAAFVIIESGGLGSTALHGLDSMVVYLMLLVYD